MLTRSFLMTSAVAVAVLVLASACSSSSSDAGQTPTPDGGGSDSGGDKFGDSGSGDKDAGGCASITLGASDVSCTTNQDCSLVVTGQVCPGYVSVDGFGTLCKNGAANSVGVARVAAVLASVPQGTDAGVGGYCDALPLTPVCVAHQCTVCGQGGVSCPDAGDGAPDADATHDAAAGDGGT